jgi:HlyD family secretion protein
MAVLLSAVSLIIWGSSQLKPAAPTVERATVLMDTVKRGPMIRQVHGIGTLVAEEVLWIPASTEGRVERIVVRPGTLVKRDTVLLELTNPELRLALLRAEWEVKAAEANYTDLRVRLESQRLDQQATAARVASEHAQAQLNSEVEQKLSEQGLTSNVKLKTMQAIADELANRSKIEKQKSDISAESITAQLASQRVEIEKLGAELKLKQEQVEKLHVRAGAVGVLQELPVQVGQQFAAGAVLAKVSQPSKLKAELKVGETQAKDIQIGQPASIDTRNGIIQGHVSRIDPAVLNGTVTVDVRLEGELPQGARPDLSVDGTIELERLDDVLYVGRPVIVQPFSTISLFRLEPDNKEAVRVPVKLGRISVNTVEILQGLKAGDQTILSDMSAHDAHNRIRLN